MTTTGTDATYNTITTAYRAGVLNETLEVISRNLDKPDEYRSGFLTGYVEGRLAARAHDNPPDESGPVSFPLAPKTEPVPVKPSALVDDVLAKVTEITAGLTGYSVKLLDPDLDLEADLGVDTVKQERVFAAVVEGFDLDRSKDMQLRDLPTLNHIAGWVRDNIS